MIVKRLGLGFSAVLVLSLIAATSAVTRADLIVETPPQLGDAGPIGTSDPSAGSYNTLVVGPTIANYDNGLGNAGTLTTSIYENGSNELAFKYTISPTTGDYTQFNVGVTPLAFAFTGGDTVTAVDAVTPGVVPNKVDITLGPLGEARVFFSETTQTLPSADVWIVTNATGFVATSVAVIDMLSANAAPSWAPTSGLGQQFVPEPRTIVGLLGVVGMMGFGLVWRGRHGRA